MSLFDLLLCDCLFIYNQTQLIIISLFMQKTHYQTGPNFFGKSARKSWFDEGDRCSPGPGAHDPQRLNKTNPPFWTSGNDEERDAFLQKYHIQYPSPDKYQVINNNKTHYEQPRYSIPVCQNQENPNKIDTGNSLDYRPNYDNSKQKYPDYSFGYYFGRDYSTAVPPPDSYNPKRLDRKSFNRTQRAFSVGGRPLPYGEEGKYPHAAKYSISRELGGTQYSVGVSQRPNYTIGASPGKFYEVGGDMKRGEKAKTIGLKIELPVNKDSADFPSFNKYNPQLSKTSRNIISYRAKRSQIKIVAAQSNPGPDKYDKKLLPKSQTVSFTKEKRYSPEPDINPGVGTYNVEKQFDKTLGHMALKIKKLSQFVNPAPSTYEPKQDLTRPTSQRPISFHSNRIDFSKSVTGVKVGPGVYEVRRKQSLSYGKIGNDQKFARNKNYNPGPGSYDIPNGIGKLPKYCSGPKKLTTTGFSCIQLDRQQRKKAEMDRVNAKKQAIQLQQDLKMEKLEKEMSLKLNNISETQ